jgi:hypothetical protein
VSLAQACLDRLLKLDVESYVNGRSPGALALKEAPLLENWWADIVCELKREPPHVAGEITLFGHVAGHPKHADGALIRTAALAWLDRHGKWARARDGLYRLGHRSDAPESRR